MPCSGSSTRIPPDVRVDDLDRAVAALRGGGLVGLPTETVYGLGADAANELAVRRVFEVKRRPADHPLIVHIAAADDLDGWGQRISESARVLAGACWPGPLTLLLERSARVIPAVTGGRDTVGIRVPAHPVALELLARFAGGVAAPSANRFGGVSPTTAEHVRRDLGDHVDVVLDGGPCRVGVESTIVDCTVDPPQILRPGAITADDVESLLDGLVPARGSGPPRAPGMLASHYAPRCRIVLVETPLDAERAATAAMPFGRVDVLDPAVGLADYARNVYAWLRDADDRGVDVLVVVMPPPDGLGHAIRDRLTKAAAPRPTG
jgi:L-threonylcarbamoyladenylate synthase